MKSLIATVILLALTGCATTSNNPEVDEKNIFITTTTTPDFKRLDCAKNDEKQCVFWAVMETVAYTEACPNEIDRRFKQTTPPEKKLELKQKIDGFLHNWSVYQVKDPIIHEAFNTNNVMYKKVLNTMKDYLAKSTANDAGEMCLSTMLLLQNNDITLEYADINRLTATPIDKNWIKKYQ